MQLYNNCPFCELSFTLKSMVKVWDPSNLVCREKNNIVKSWNKAVTQQYAKTLDDTKLAALQDS